jgi:hypothetical protein
MRSLQEGAMGEIDQSYSGMAQQQLINHVGKQANLS